MIATLYEIIYLNYIIHHLPTDYKYDTYINYQLAIASSTSFIIVR